MPHHAAACEKGAHETVANRYFASGKPWKPTVETVLTGAMAEMLAELSHAT